MKTFIQSGTGSTATLQEANPSKIRVFDTYEDAVDALSDIKENEIVCIKEASDDQVRDATVPVGTIVSYLSDNIPDGWLLCDGSDIPEKYVRLRELIGTKTPVSINYPDLIPETVNVDTVSQVAISGYYSWVQLTVRRTGNVVSVAGIIEQTKRREATICATGLPKPAVCQNTVHGNNIVMPGMAGSTTGGSARLTIAPNGSLSVYSTTDGLGNIYFSTEYITNDYDGTAHYNIIKAAPNQSEVQDIEMNVPVGTLISYRGQTTPVGFLRADGSTFDKDKYPLLYTALGNTNVLPVEIENNTPETVPENATRTTLYSKEITSGSSFTDENTVVATADGTILFDVAATNNNHVIDQSIDAYVDNKSVVVFNQYQVVTHYPEHMYWFKVKKGQEIKTRVHMTANTFANDGQYRACQIHVYFYENVDLKYKYIKATSGIDSEEETIATAVNEAVKEALNRLEPSHNIPRSVPKDITTYYTDGSLWKRIAGTDGYELFEDIYVGDYFKMSRAISAYERTGQYQTTGSQYVTIAGLDTKMNDNVNYHHAVMVPGQGFGGTQHFGRARMNSSYTTEGGYKASEMNTTTIGAIAAAGDTSATASINAQLFAEFGSHLKTTRELVTNALNANGYNRFGNAGGCASDFDWISAQAVLMSEVEAYGATVWSSSGYDTGNANVQLPLFAFSKAAVGAVSGPYWLKDLASGSDFCNVGGSFQAGFYGASHADLYVRPRFILAA